MAIFDSFRRWRDSQTPEGEQMDAAVTGGEEDAGGEADNVYQLPQSQPIGTKEIAEAAVILQKYKAGKANLETRVVEDEQWWELRHWEVIRKKKQQNYAFDADPKAPYKPPEPASAWLFNAIVNKHADAMDSIPEAVVLPREQSDEASAQVLSEVVPTLMDQVEFEHTYSDVWWEKLKHGTGVYGVFWDSRKENGLGDIDIRSIDLLKIFWEPGITDLQQSRNLFIVDLVDTDLLDQLYPEHAGKMAGNNIDVSEYIYDDSVDTSGKSVVVDWYYKKANPGGGQILHYAKFVGGELLYASENDPQYSGGWYAHGQYPVVFDNLYPEKGTPAGFGYIAICKDPQLYIDKLSGNILESSMMASKKRYFVSSSTNINRQNFLDWNDPIIEVEGELDDTRLREMTHDELPTIYYNVLMSKIDEMKETAANRDFNQGSTSSGVTAASAIAALQESGSKVSRDMINASYRAFSKIVLLMIELMRQFYDESRSFRVVGNGGAQEYAAISSQQLGMQAVGTDIYGEMLYRKPIFDLKISAQKHSPFSQAAQNETATNLYQLGFFNPQRADEALAALDMMSFEGIDKVKKKIQEGQTLYNIVQQQAAQLQQMAAILTGGAAGGAGGAAENAASEGEQVDAGSVNRNAAAAQTPQAGMQTQAAQRMVNQ